MNNALVVALIAACFSVLASALSAMNLARFSSVEVRLGAIEGLLMKKGG